MLPDELEVTEGEGQPTGEPSGAAPSGDTGRVPPGYVPISRLNEALAKNREFKETIGRYGKLGTPEEIEAERTRSGELSKGRRFTEAEKAKLREEMDEVYPELKGIRTDKEARVALFNDKGRSLLTNFSKEVWPETTPTRLKILEDTMAAVIASDAKLVLRFWQGDESVFAEAWKAVKQELGLGAIRRSADSRLVDLKKKPTGGGKPAPKGEEKPADEITNREKLSRAGDRAFDILEANPVE